MTTLTDHTGDSVARVDHQTGDRSTPVPRLKYDLRRRDGDGIRGDGPPLYNVHDVSVHMWPDGLNVWARGRMLRKDGEMGPNRCVLVDLDQPQPAWLTAIVLDAHQRLGVDANVCERCGGAQT